MEDINELNIICDFCGKKKSFGKTKQVPLRIDKSNQHQHLFAMQCNSCEKQKNNVTLNGQNIRLFTGQAKNSNDLSILDELNNEEE
jgi:hypothetical protein